MDLRRELLALETAIARRDEAAIPGGYEAVLDDGFTEIGSSGRVWDRATIVAALSAAPAAASGGAMEIAGFEVRPLSEGVVLATFSTTQEVAGGAPLERLRSSVWVRRDGRWRLAFHQGTPRA